ncbi:MAG: hypothetical protein K8U57_06175 [Planctomycetes bacterium]|nr:hypothetical protein [Planctomycetota bacterium]
MIVAGPVRGDKETKSVSPSFLLVFITFLALPIFAHGCHRGDHDDEPLVVPIEHRVEAINPAQ